MKRMQVVGVGLTGAILGAGGLWAVFGIIHIKSMPPSNAPVVVRGGSVEGRVPAGNPGEGWEAETSGTPHEWQTQDQVDLTSLSIGGVVPHGGGKVEQHTATGLKANWKVTLIFRDHNGNEPDPTNDDESDPNKQKLYLCSAKNCAMTGTLASPGYFYLYDPDNNGNFAADQYLDGNDMWRYDLNMCNGVAPARDTACNHVVRLRVHGLDGWDDHSLNLDFQCKVGECDIGVGPQQ